MHMPDRFTRCKGFNLTHPLHVIKPFIRVIMAEDDTALEKFSPLLMPANTKLLALELHHHAGKDIADTDFRVLHGPVQLLPGQLSIVIRIDMFLTWLYKNGTLAVPEFCASV